MHLKELCLRKPLNQQQVLQWLVSPLARRDSHETLCHDREQPRSLSLSFLCFAPSALFR